MCVYSVHVGTCGYGSQSRLGKECKRPLQRQEVYSCGSESLRPGPCVHDLRGPEPSETRRVPIRIQRCPRNSFGSSQETYVGGVEREILRDSADSTRSDLDDWVYSARVTPESVPCPGSVSPDGGTSCSFRCLDFFKSYGVLGPTGS